MWMLSAGECWSQSKWFIINIDSSVVPLALVAQKKLVVRNGEIFTTNQNNKLTVVLVVSPVSVIKIL